MAKYTNEAGEEVETLSPEEVTALQTERDTLVAEKTTLAEEKARLEKGGSDKDENIVKLRTWAENNEKKLDEVTKRLAEKDEYEKTSVKNTLLEHFAGADEESRKKLEEEYALINIDESTPENIAKRMEKAARVSGLYKEEGGENPIFRGGFRGSGPVLKPTRPSGDDPDNVLNTEKGKSALAAMGIPTEEKK